MSRPLRILAWPVLAVVACAAAVGSPIATDHTKCTASGTIALSILGAGVLAVIAALLAAEVRLRWAIVAASVYSAGVYVVDAAAAISNCTA